MATMKSMTATPRATTKVQKASAKAYKSMKTDKLKKAVSTGTIKKASRPLATSTRKATAISSAYKTATKRVK